MKTTHVTYDTDTSAFLPLNLTVEFSGTGDRLQFMNAGFDKITATGTDQIVSINNGESVTIVDHGQGLILELLGPEDHITVKDFQNDATGKLFANVAIFEPDGHGGTMAIGLKQSIDFVAFHDIAALEARIISTP